jgi:hypothetical protein
MTKPRMYNEAKAKRSIVQRNVLSNKLSKSLGKREKKEKFWQDEIKAIDDANVLLNCKSCGRGIIVKINDWYTGKYGRICRICKDKQIKQELVDITTKIQPLLPKDYTVFARSDDQIIIWKRGTK